MCIRDSYYPSTEKIDRSTQFGAVGYIITLYSLKSYVKSWGSVQILGRSGFPQPPSGCTHGHYVSGGRSSDFWCVCVRLSNYQWCHSLSKKLTIDFHSIIYNEHVRNHWRSGGSGPPQNLDGPQLFT